MIFRFSQGLWQRHTLKNRGMNTGRRKKPKEESVRFWVTLKQWVLRLEPRCMLCSVQKDLKNEQ